ncbi:hypothetical protein SP18gp277 [Shigella phage SP18]|uniref:Uncharacterized protein n=1 Tax=Shigella phage SP18 TaxID=645664 RepID=E3SF80_BPSP8|nr:hypothetical protein SP18_gp277 [Shigella phage SP18]ADO19617.1 hypothetical protein SP18gp277 [Shigella phage SP18]
MSKIFFGNRNIMFFKQISISEAFDLSYSGGTKAVNLKNLMSAEFAFYQDPETGFYKFIKFRMTMDRGDVYYTSYESVINAIREAYGLDSLSLDRLYNASLYTSGFILEQLQK